MTTEAIFKIEYNSLDATIDYDLIFNKKNKRSSSNSFLTTITNEDNRSNFNVSYINHFNHCSLKTNNIAEQYILYLYNDVEFKIWKELEYIEEAIKKSEYILDLHKEWGDIYTKYDLYTWWKAIDFLICYSELVFKEFNKKIISPKIYHGPEGSIDILFENAKFSLLLNVNKGGSIGEFYGNDSNNNSIKGLINFNSINEILLPIAVNL